MKYYITLALLLLITLGGCVKKTRTESFKENDIVTWKINDELIIKGHLGQRRKHIVGEFDAEFYHPNTQQFMGQFPIDYLPKKFDPISKSEAVTLQQNNTGNPFEFYLMLNGSWVEPTDESINAPKALDHEDQVKIQVKRYYRQVSPYNTKQNFEENQMKHLDKNSEHELYGMKCFNFLDSQGKRCLGQSSNPNISGFDVLLLPNHRLPVRYQEFIYGGISIEYILNKKNLDNIHQIDQAIWRFINTWNVAP